MTPQPSLSETFQQFFDIELANNEEARSRVYHVRYRVYAEEFGYEDINAFPDKQEKDHYDGRSTHCVIMHKKSGLAAGCVRMVPAAPGTDIGALLPMEEHCPDALDHEFIDSLGLDRNSVCEISRLAVDGAFRRRAGETSSRFGELSGLDISAHEERTFSLISVAAFLASTAMTDLAKRTNVFAMMEPFLPRLLAKSGICFERAGEDVDYHGVRAPYFIKTQSAVENMRSELRELYDAIHDRIRVSY